MSELLIMGFLALPGVNVRTVDNRGSWSLPAQSYQLFSSGRPEASAQSHHSSPQGGLRPLRRVSSPPQGGLRPLRRVLLPTTPCRVHTPCTPSLLHLPGYTRMHAVRATVSTTADRGCRCAATEPWALGSNTVWAGSLLPKLMSELLGKSEGRAPRRAPCLRENN